MLGPRPRILHPSTRTYTSPTMTDTSIPAVSDASDVSDETAFDAYRRSPEAAALLERHRAVLQRVALAERAAGRPEGSVTLIAVGKTFPFACERLLYEAGARNFGENYVQEGVEKSRGMALLAPAEDRPAWHLIGTLQSNKTAAAATAFDWVHSVDRLKIARRLSEARLAAGLPPLEILLEVNADDEEGKGGVDFAELPALADAVAPLTGVRLRGLMAIPDPTLSETLRRNAFERVARAFEALRAAHPELPVDTLSMGMTHDLEWAVEAGSTMVRVGTAIFGPRDYSRR